MQRFDIAIIGAGVMGAAAACELSLDGLSVALIDQSAVPNPRAASVDHSKVFRFAYPEPFYVSLAVDALARWRELETRTGVSLLTHTGALLIGRSEPSFATECHDAMRSSGVETRMLDDRQIGELFPQFDNSSFSYGVYDPAGAILHAEPAVRAMLVLARQRGVTIIEGMRVAELTGSPNNISIAAESGAAIHCKRAMVASGPWSRKLVSLLKDKLTTTRQELVYFQPAPSESDGPQPSFAPDKFPIFLELESGFYGFPIHHAGSMKIANHHKGVEVDPDSTPEEVGENFIAGCRAFFAEFIPGLVTATVRETRVCMYNNTPDDDFIIDWHPDIEGVLLVTGFSGHGFKFGPAIGRIAADLLTTGYTSSDINRFRLLRFNNHAKELI